MRDLDVLSELVEQGKAIDAAAKARSANANEVVFYRVEVDRPVLKSGEIETNPERIAAMQRILGIAGKAAALAIDASKLPPEDVRRWVSSSLGNKPAARMGWTVASLGPADRLWLDQGEDGGLVQQHIDFPTSRMVMEAPYPTDDTPMKEVWSIGPEDYRGMRYGVSPIWLEVEPYAHYYGVRANAKAFFAFIARAGVIDEVSAAVAKEIAPDTQN